MSDENRKRPTFIKATNVKGLVMKDNVGIGDADFAHLENVEGLEASGNVHITPDKPDGTISRAWYERPVGIVVLGLVVVLVGGAILYYLGWA
jgi:hypothetical protein